MKVRAKFQCDRIIRTQWSPVYTEWKVSLRPICGNDGEYGENTKFHKSTPSGNLEMVIDNEAAQPAFEVGKAYYVDFTPAE